MAVASLGKTFMSACFQMLTEKIAFQCTLFMHIDDCDERCGSATYSNSLATRYMTSYIHIISTHKYTHVMLIYMYVSYIVTVC